MACRLMASRASPKLCTTVWMRAPNCSVGPGRGFGLGQRELTHHVVHVRLGLDEQVGGNVTEDDGVAPLRGRGRVRVDAGELLDGLDRLERVVDAGRAELGPHDLSVLVDRDAPPRAQRFHQQDAATGHVAGAAVRANGGSGAGVADTDAHASGGTTHRDRDRGGAVLARVRQQLGGDDRRVVDDVDRTTGKQLVADEAAPGAPRARLVVELQGGEVVQRVRQRNDPFFAPRLNSPSLDVSGRVPEIIPLAVAS